MIVVIYILKCEIFKRVFFKILSGCGIMCKTHRKIPIGSLFVVVQYYSDLITLQQVFCKDYLPVEFVHQRCHNSSFHIKDKFSSQRTFLGQHLSLL